MKLKVGLIGLGRHWESRHRPALIAMRDRFDIKAICCEISQKAQQVASDFGAKAIDGFRSMVERQDIEAVLSLGPDWVGHLPILAACDAGKAVYSATALELETKNVEAILDRVRKSGVAFTAEYPRRHSAATLRLKELIATELGPPENIFCHLRLDPGSLDHSEDPKVRRMMLRAQMMEMVDWVCFLCGRNPEKVLAVGADPKSYGHECRTAAYDDNQEFVDDNEDDVFVFQQLNYHMMNLWFGKTETSCHASAQISLGTYIPSKWSAALDHRRPASIQISCQNGIAFIDLPSNLVWFNSTGRHEESLDYERSVGEQMLAYFYRSVTNFLDYHTDLDDTARVIRIMDAWHKSLQTGTRQPVA